MRSAAWPTPLASKTHRESKSSFIPHPAKHPANHLQAGNTLSKNTDYHYKNFIHARSLRQGARGIRPKPERQAQAHLVDQIKGVAERHHLLWRMRRCDVAHAHAQEKQKLPLLCR
jgi:hypothetical protein